MLPMDAFQGRIYSGPKCVLQPGRGEKWAEAWPSAGTWGEVGRSMSFGRDVGRSGPKYDLRPGGVKRFVRPGRVRKLDGKGGLNLPAVPQSATRGPAWFRKTLRKTGPRLSGKSRKSGPGRERERERERMKLSRRSIHVAIKETTTKRSTTTPHPKQSTTRKEK